MTAPQKIKSWIKSRENQHIFWRGLLSQYRRLRRYSEFYIKDTLPPDFMQLEPTTKCNCHCVTCGGRNLRSPHLKKDLSLDEFKRILSGIPSLKIIQLQGIGEPLMCENIEAILEYGLARGIEFNTNSNATLLDDHHIDLVLRYFKNFSISIDSMVKENFEKIRAGANFDQVMHNTKRLAARKKETGAETNILLYFVVTHLNYRELPMFFDFCESVGAEAEIRECMHWLWMNPEHKAYTEVTDFIRNARSVRDEIRNIIGDCKNNIAIRFYQVEEARSSECSWPFNGTYVTADGFVTPCCLIPDPRLLNFGNIFETPFHQIWNSKPYKSFRKKIVSGSRHPLCERCFIHVRALSVEEHQKI